MNHSRLRQAAFTLIEMLAVVVIASLVIALGGLNISATSERTAFTRMVAALQQMDARARLHARSSGGIMVIRVEMESRLVRLVTRQRELLAELVIPSMIEMTVETADAKPRIVFDARGVSDDYALTLRADGHTVRLNVHGLTGEIATMESAS